MSRGAHWSGGVGHGILRATEAALAQVHHHGTPRQREGDAGEAARPRLRPRPHQRRRHLPLARPQPDQARHARAALHERGAADPGRDGLGRREVAARDPRLAPRVRARRLPAQRRPGELLSRELRHRRGDRDRARRGVGDSADAEPPALLELRPRLQPDPAAPAGSRRLRQLRRAARDARRRHPGGDPHPAAGVPREDAADPGPAEGEGADRARRRHAFAGRGAGRDAPQAGARPHGRRGGRGARRGRPNPSCWTSSGSATTACAGARATSRS
jgi:hypothetical protein